MTASITMNNQLSLRSSYLAGLQKKEVSINPDFSDVGDTQPADVPSTPDIQFSSQISSLNKAEIGSIYNQIKLEAKAKLEKDNVNNTELKPFDYHKSTIDEIMLHPLVVKVEPDEIHTAILYNRMGISYLDVKQAEVRMELLKLAEEDVENSAQQASISEEQRLGLSQIIASNLLKLEDEKQALLEGDQMRKNQQELFEQLRCKGQ
ncbi:hypothetical protein Sps_02253 [Shewanella psychrophila]|uniref:Uncharacterized protein n=1 Tax=Shewanella psychrophila TaxID=225848 RepID=A0A1S6HPF8_9GAMM|nr:hypothetical protein [Shewanella psychrophila]AQS37411.1 hypothetical protein Sps_02253 [Shewanella psychrophila]